MMPSWPPQTCKAFQLSRFLCVETVETVGSPFFILVLVLDLSTHVFGLGRAGGVRRPVLVGEHPQQLQKKGRD